MKKAISISALIFFFAYFSYAGAQVIGTASIDGIDIGSSPANPTPGSSVTVTLDSYSTNLSAAGISWTVGGKSFASGTGMDTIPITAPATGQTLQVMADIQTIEGADIEKAISITSGNVDIVWETSGYVPPLYQGKAPFVYQNKVTFIAIPHLVDANGNPIDPKNLIYQWKENTFVMGSQSGYGKQSLQVSGSVIAQPLDIDVTVSSEDGSAHAESQITLQPTSPSIVFYQDDPLYGVLYNGAIAGTLQLVHNQTKVVAVPYGFDTSAPGTVYDWDINGVPQGNLSSSTSVILGVNAGQQGSSNISLGIQNMGQNILQGAQSSFTAIFENQAAAATSSVIF